MTSQFWTLPDGYLTSCSNLSQAATVLSVGDMSVQVRPSEDQLRLSTVS